MADSYSSGHDILHRFEGNPIITIEDIPFRCNTVFNGAVVKKEEVYYHLLRVEGQQGYSVFALARSKDGLHFDVDSKPVMVPAKEGPFAKYESYGIEDPRITEIEGKYYVMYTAYSQYGTLIGLAETKDFVNYQRIALVSEPGNKDGILFPEKIDRKYARLDRPIGKNTGSMWVSYSKDLINWGRSELMMTPRSSMWDSFRIGASVPPIRTDKGWLEIYHGVKMTSAGPIYRIGTVLLDLKQPHKVIARCSKPVLSPRTDYERIGDVFNVVFACGAVVESSGEIKVYYGAADTCICVATTDFCKLIEATVKE
jgi:predicted GH43/DUF377 family glycosyl hydrolase